MHFIFLAITIRISIYLYYDIQNLQQQQKYSFYPYHLKCICAHTCMYVKYVCNDCWIKDVMLARY